MYWITCATQTKRRMMSNNLPEAIIVSISFNATEYKYLRNIRINKQYSHLLPNVQSLSEHGCTNHFPSRTTSLDNKHLFENDKCLLFIWLSVLMSIYIIHYVLSLCIWLNVDVADCFDGLLLFNSISATYLIEMGSVTAKCNTKYTYRSMRLCNALKRSERHSYVMPFSQDPVSVNSINGKNIVSVSDGDGKWMLY